MNKYILTSALLFTLLFSSSSVAFAAPRTNPFTLGQTIDPGAESTEPCGPTDTNCFVAVLGADDEGGGTERKCSTIQLCR